MFGLKKYFTKKRDVNLNDYINQKKAEIDLEMEGYKSCLKKNIQYEHKEGGQYFEYTPKFRKEITDHILLETFDEDIEIFKAIQPSDTLIAKNKNDIIKLINDGESPFISVGVWFCILKGIDVEKKKDEIIKEIEKLDNFKWVRISYIRTELSSYDIERFENYKKNGFPKI